MPTKYLYFISSTGANPFVASVTYPCTCTCPCLKHSHGPKHFQWEGALKILFTTLGFTLEIITAFKGGKFVHYGNGQHATMFFFFGLSGVTDILVHYKLPLPKGIDYVMMSLAFIIEGLLFKFHLHGRTELDVLIHTLLLYSIYANALFCLLEMRYRSNPLATLCRSYFVLLQGTWFWQVGFILYNPLPGAKAWLDDDHEQMMLATMMFTWHMGACLIIMLFIGAVIGCLYRVQGEFRSIHYDQLGDGVKLLPRNQHGQSVVHMQENEESDEFEQTLLNDS